MTRYHLLLAFLLATTVVSAQNATISRFKFWTADTAYSIWGDTSTVFVYKAPDGSKAMVLTADTMYKYTVAQLNKRLDITLENLNVDGTMMDAGKERITGFPDRKVKTVLADGKFGMVVEVEAVMYASWHKADRPKAPPLREFEMRVTVESFDGRGTRTAKYMDRARSADISTAAWQVGYDKRTGLTGNQLMELYVKALENAMNTKR